MGYLDLTADSSIAESMTANRQKANYTESRNLGAPGKQGPADLKGYAL